MQIKAGRKGAVFLSIVLTGVICQAAQSDGFAKSTYYYPDSNSKSDAVEESVNLQGLPESDKPFMSEAFKLLAKYLTAKKMVIRALQMGSSAGDAALANCKLAAQDILPKLVKLDDSSSEVCSQVKNALGLGIKEQLQIFEDALGDSSAGKPYDDLLSSEAAKTNSARISGIWNLLLNKYGMSSEAKKSIGKQLSSFELSETPMPL